MYAGILGRDSTLESKRTILNLNVGVALMELCSLAMIIVDLRVETCLRNLALETLH